MTRLQNINLDKCNSLYLNEQIVPIVTKYPNQLYVSFIPPYFEGTKEMAGLQGTKEMTGLQGTKEMVGLQGTKEMTGLQGTKEMTGLQGTKWMAGLHDKYHNTNET